MANHVPSKEVRTIYFILSLLPVLHEYNNKLRASLPWMVHSQVPEHWQLKQVQSALQKLIWFCTEGPHGDPLTREGTPVTGNQTALRELGVVELLLAMVTRPLQLLPKGDAIHLDEAQYAGLNSICTLAYRLLRQICVGHAKNGEYTATVGLYVMIKQIRAMNPLSTSWGIASTLSAMFENNSALLHSVRHFFLSQLETNTHIFHFIAICPPVGCLLRIPLEVQEVFSLPAVPFIVVFSQRKWYS